MFKKLAFIAGVAMLLSACGGNDGGGAPASSSPVASQESQGKTAEKPLERGQVAQALLDGQFERVHERMSEAFRKEISVDRLREGYAGFAESVAEWQVISQLELNGGHMLAWTDSGGGRGVVATFDKEGVITGLRLLPLERFPDTDETPTKQAYGLPFEGEWYVFWGGRNVLSNYHYEYASQRYAYDLVRVEDGFSYRGDATKNESYFAFGQPILAPYDGKVVHVVNDIPDNDPVGSMNPEQPAGNVVVIDHGNGEFSFLAHLQEGSVEVKVGDRVAKGDEIGLSGNSGNSSEPHLHYQVSDRPDLFEGKSIRVQWDGGLDPVQGMSVGRK